MTANPSRLSKDNPQLAIGKDAPFLGGISQKHFLTNARDKTRQDLDRQISQLHAHILRKLKKCAAMYTHGRTEAALQQACEAAEAKARMFDLIGQREKLQDLEATPKTPVYRRGSTVKTKPRRYKTWSEE